MERGESQQELEILYRNRFSDQELASKLAFWKVLCERVFQKYVPVDGTTLDLAAGNCEFVNNITAARRIAVDLNPDVRRFADTGVEVMVVRSDEMVDVVDGTVDTVFTSNFFEHLPSKDALLDTLRECRRVTKPGGRIVVLMPNIRYLAGRYWDYFDHHLPLTHLSLSEALDLAGYDVQEVVPRFLPYTVKDAKIDVRPWMVSAYLQLKPVWRLLGRQMLVVATPRPLVDEETPAGPPGVR
jgi:SAM-dependent methyltransferase